MEKRNIIDAIRTLDRDTVLKNVVYRMVNRERMAGFLKDAPHREFFDVAAVYSCQVARDDGTCGIALSNEMCGHYGISFEELDTAARKNTEAAGFATYTMPAMWIISDESLTNGASALLYPDLFGRIADQAGCDLYILPSSIHEVIAVRAAGYEPEKLSEIVQFVNRTEVDEKDYLSDSVYRYCRDGRKIIIEAGQKKIGPNA